MPGLFAMKRESWARLVRVSSLPRYAPSRRIAKGLSLSLVFLFGPRQEQHRSRPTPETSDLSISNPALSPYSRASCVAHYQRTEQKATLSARRVLSRSGVEWRGEEDILATLIPYPCTERPSARLVLPCRPPAENFQVHRAESPSSLTVTGWNLGNVFVPLRVAEGMRNVWRF